MPNSPKRFCKVSGCGRIAEGDLGFCKEHIGLYLERAKGGRDYHKGGSAAKRGYGKRWQVYAKWFLRQPGNEFCKLHMDDACAIVAQCVDHIDPPDSADDPRFWDRTNHQPACIHCNSRKRHRNIRGDYVFGGVNVNGETIQKR